MSTADLTRGTGRVSSMSILYFSSYILWFSRKFYEVVMFVDVYVLHVGFGICFLVYLGSYCSNFFRWERLFTLS